MLKNYLKIAFRTIWKGKLYSLINIAGLALGISVTLLIGAFIADELSVNNNLKDVDRSYVIHSKWSPENMGVFYTTLGPLADALREEFPGKVEACYRYTLASSTVSSSADKIFREQLQIGDTSLIHMFGFKLLHGNASSAFANNGIVLTESFARKYFSRSDVLGQSLDFQTNAGNKVTYQIAGVLDDLPSNTVVNFANNPVQNEIFLPMSAIEHFMGDADKNWSFPYMVSIIKLAPNVPSSDIERALKDITKRHASTEIANSLELELKPLKSYYVQWADQKILKLIRTLGMVALFILLLVIANFVSIMISTASQRMREIGVRKLFGGVRRQLILQFLTETIVLSLFACILSLGIYAIVKRPFEGLVGRQLLGLDGFDTRVFIGLFIISVLIGYVAGLYPAFRLSNFRIAQAIKGKLPSLKEGNLMRKALLCFQLATASFVLITSFFMAKQLNFIQRFDLGYQQDGVMVITSLPRKWDADGVAKLETVRLLLTSEQGISSASISYDVPDGNAGTRYNFQSREDIRVDMPMLNVDQHFANTFGLKLLAGNFFHAVDGTHKSNSVVINQKAAKEFGWTAEGAIGNQITYGEHEESLTVVGVTNDFHFYSLFQSLEPLAMIHISDRSTYRYLSLRLVTGNVMETVANVQQKWIELFPDAPFDYIFMNEKLQQFYAAEERMFTTSKIAGYITGFVTICGIAAFMSVNVARRVKEIGIRRVHGASPASIAALFVTEFFWQFAIAGIAAFTTAYYFLKYWLSEFQYKVTLSPELFILIYLVVVAFTIILVVMYSLRAIFMNPVETLRYE